MKSIAATLLVLIPLALLSSGLKSAVVEAAPPQCSLNQNCRLYCARFGTAPLCFNGVCTCFSKKISAGMQAGVAAPKCSGNENCRLYCARFGTTPLCFEGVCRCFSKDNE